MRMYVERERETGRDRERERNRETDTERDRERAERGIDGLIEKRDREGFGDVSWSLESSPRLPG